MRYAWVFVLVLSACEQRHSEPAASGAPIGSLEAIEGTPRLTRAGKSLPANAGTRVFAGDRVSTPAGAKVRVVFTDGSILAAGANTTLTLTDLRTEGVRRQGRIAVTAGRFWMQVSQWTGGGTDIEVATPHAVAGVRGTTLWGDTEVDAICALDGTITVRSTKADVAPVQLVAGRCAAELSQGRLSPLAPTAQQVSRYLDEVLIR